jgi:hypothetical protein
MHAIITIYEVPYIIVVVVIKASGSRKCWEVPE